MDLFPFVDSLFDTKKWQLVSDADKKKHFYMANKFLSIQFPIEANNFNINGVNQILVMNMWHQVMSRKFSRTPAFVYTKVVKSDNGSELDKKFSKLDKEAIKRYISDNQLGSKDFQWLKSIFLEDLISEIKQIEDHMIDCNK